MNRYDILENLKYSEFKDLLFHLKKLSSAEDDISKQVEVEAKLNYFFPELSALEEMELNHVASAIFREDTTSEDLFNIFKENHPKLKIDTLGLSHPFKKNYWEIELKSLDSVYELAQNYLQKNNYRDETHGKINSQVVNAKDLNNLNNIKLNPSMIYDFDKTLFLKKFNNEYINNQNFNKYEKLVYKYTKNNIFMHKLIEYITRKDKPVSYGTFINHVFSRLDILDKDVKLTNEENKSYLKKIKELSK
jgi:hypothetical protein